MRRKDLEKIIAQKDTNTGLWMRKYFNGNPLQASIDDKGAKSKLIEDLTETIKEPGTYKEFYNIWKESLSGNDTLLGKAMVNGRLAIGLGDENVSEFSFTLHHTYGVPLIRGSAIKGLAASFARNRIKGLWKPKTNTNNKTNSDSPYRTVFGDPGDNAEAGFITFHDALYIPGSRKDGRALYPDIITVHHPKYYQGEKDSPPADWDEPVPSPLLSATGSFLIAISGADKLWRSAAFTILKQALDQEGIGAKTSSGYGRMKLEEITI